MNTLGLHSFLPCFCKKITDPIWACFRLLFLFMLTTLFLLPTDHVNAQSSAKKIDKLASQCNTGDAKACKSIIEIAVRDKETANRIYAVSQLNDQASLIAVVSQSYNSDILKAAATKLTNTKSTWDAILKMDWSRQIEAFNQLNNQDAYFYGAKNTTEYSAWTVLLKKINDQTVLTNLIVNSIFTQDKYYYLFLVNDQNILNSLVWDKSSTELNQKAVHLVRDKKNLLEIVLSHPDAYVRYSAIQKIDDTVSMIAIASKETDKKVRREAVRRIKDQKFLADLVKSNPDSELVLVSLENLIDQPAIIDLVKNNPDSRVREAAKLKLTDQSMLLDIARYDPDPAQRKPALYKIHDDVILMKIALTSPDQEIRSEAAYRLDSESNAAEIFRQSNDPKVRLAALVTIDRKDILSNLYKEFPYLVYMSNKNLLLNKSCPEKVKTYVAFNYSAGNDYLIPIDVEYKDGKPCIWCNGAVHTWIGDASLVNDLILSVVSDKEDPLTFVVQQQKGYVYVHGKGKLDFRKYDPITYPGGGDKGATAVRWLGHVKWEGLEFTISFTSDVDWCVFTGFTFNCSCIDKTTSIKYNSEKSVFLPINNEFVIQLENKIKLTGKIDYVGKKIIGHFSYPSNLVCNDNKSFPAEGNWNAFPVKEK